MGFQYSYYCRIYGFDLPTSSTNTDMRGAAGGRQLAAAETIVLLYITPGSYSAHTDAVYFVDVILQYINNINYKTGPLIRNRDFHIRAQAMQQYCPPHKKGPHKKL